MPSDPTPLNFPIPTRPEPEVLDTLFYDLVDIRVYPAQVRLPYGSEHPDTINYPAFKLVNEQVVDYKWVKRWWSNSPSNQDWYNYGIDYSSGETAFPIFTRRYLVRRDQYIPAAKLSTMLGVYLIKVTNGGSLYTEPPTVALTGGAGAGATARAVINVSGQVAWVLIVTEGSGYTSAPAVGFSGGGAGAGGATATAFVQAAACQLYDEQVDELPNDDPRRSLYVIVRKVYETYPGPMVETIMGYEDETGALMERFTQRYIFNVVSVPGFGTEYPAASGLFVLDAKFQPDEKNDRVGTLVVDVMAVPDPREETEDHNYPGPKLFTLTYGTSGWSIPPAYPASPSGPYQNRSDHKDYTGSALPNDALHRGTYELQGGTPLGPVTATYTYFVTPPGAVPSVFVLTGQPGRQLHMIDNYTIHGALTLIFEDAATAGTVVIENLRATSPSTYVDGATVIGASQKQWKGCFMRRIVRTVDFPVLPNE